jgi:hypothetical protein
VVAVAKCNGKDWDAIAELVPGRPKIECTDRWYNFLSTKSDETKSRKGKNWTAEEDNKLVDAVEKCNGKDWDVIAELVPGRTKIQCKDRWYNFLISRGDETTARKGKRWTTEEDDNAGERGRKVQRQGVGCDCRAGSRSTENRVYG